MAELPTILLVDTHEDSRLIYAAVLRHQGLGVVVSDCARSALDVARTARPGVIVMELSLGASPAWSTVAALRSAPETAAIPVLGLSTTGLPEHRERALRLGCSVFLVKPLAPLELLAEVRRLLQTPGGRG